jgi:hypothetical protein
VIELIHAFNYGVCIQHGNEDLSSFSLYFGLEVARPRDELSFGQSLGVIIDRGREMMAFTRNISASRLRGRVMSRHLVNPLG